MIKALVIFLMLSIVITGQIFSQSVNKDDYSFQAQKVGVVKRGQNIWTIHTTLTNLSKDTLKYFSLRCSWADFYFVNNEKLFVTKSICEKNNPIILKLLPGQQIKRDIDLLITPTMDTTIVHFKVGINLMPANKSISEFKIKEVFFKENVIWSNEIRIKN